MKQMEIASYNVNGIRARLPRLIDWIKSSMPDVIVLQEIKSRLEHFPTEEIESLGYNIELSGQKSFNGVAVFSKFPIEGLNSELPGDPTDEQARWLEFHVRNIKICNIYLPNGNPIGSSKYYYKLDWIDRLTEKLIELKDMEEPLVVLGDFNIIPKAADCHEPEKWKNDAIFQQEVRLKFQNILNLGFTDAIRISSLSNQIFTYWDYQGRSWEKNQGVRIDHALLSPEASDKLKEIRIYSSIRNAEKPSDHVPISIILDL